jgi:hypothetical protein
MAATPKLKLQFPEIYVTPSSSHAKLNNVKYDAIEFASAAVRIGDIDFDIEMACRANADCEVAPTMEYEQGDICTFGFRKKKTAGGEQGDQAAASSTVPQQGGGRGGRGGGRGRGGGSGRGGGNGGAGRGNAAMSAPSYNGLNAGGVFLAAGGNYQAGGRMDTVDAISNRYEVRG